MEALELADGRHLEAAQGWLGLGDWFEANEELECITPRMLTHPDVLRVRYEVCAKAEKWELAADVARAISEIVPHDPFGCVHMAYALHAMKCTKQAWSVLIPVVDMFPKVYIIRYNLACYACQMGDLDAAMQWLEKAIDLADKEDIRMMALEDPDLQPLWGQIGDL